MWAIVPFRGLIKVIHLVVQVRQVPHDLRGVSEDGLQLCEAVESVLYTPQLLVDQAKVVEGLAACGLHTQGLSEEVSRLVKLARGIETAPLVHQGCILKAGSLAS